MEKGKFGLNINVIAVIAFAFVVLRQPQSVLLIAGFALLAEKNEWLNKQVIQSLLLTVTYYLAVLVSDLVFGSLARVFNLMKFYETSGVIIWANSFIAGVLFLGLTIFSLIAILRVLNGKDAGLPYFSKIMSIVEPTLQSKIELTADKRECTNCQAPLKEDAMFCTECGTKVPQ